MLPVYSLIRGAKTRRMLSELFGRRRIEELPLRFFCLSCDLIGREAVVHRTGRDRDAVYSSFAIPGVFPPVSTDGRLLVDGGVLDNLPVATMARTGEGPVIAVDVTGRVGQFQAMRRGRSERLRPLRRALTGSHAAMPRLSETIVRTVMVGSADTVLAARLHADLVITPEVEGVALMDWKALPRVRELGRRAAREALDADPELPARLAARASMSGVDRSPSEHGRSSPGAGRARRAATGARDRLARGGGRVRRRDDRQHRVPEHRPVVPGTLDLVAVMGAERLQHRVRGVPGRGRADRRPGRPPTDVRARARDVHGRVAVMRGRARRRTR